MTSKNPLHRNIRQLTGLTDKCKIDLALTTLRALLQRVLLDQVKEPKFGICLNWKLAIMDAKAGENRINPYEILNHLAADWPDTAWPGETMAYPVPDNPRYALWQADNLEYRLSLIRYMIKRLRDLKRRTKA
jgi:hypothetical protein